VIYAIAELDLDTVKDLTAQVREMNADLQRYIVEQGQNTFDRLAGEEKQ